MTGPEALPPPARILFSQPGDLGKRSWSESTSPQVIPALSGCTLPPEPVLPTSPLPQGQRWTGAATARPSSPRFVLVLLPKEPRPNARPFFGP